MAAASAFPPRSANRQPAKLLGRSDLSLLHTHYMHTLPSSPLSRPPPSPLAPPLLLLPHSVSLPFPSIEADLLLLIRSSSQTFPTDQFCHAIIWLFNPIQRTLRMNRMQFPSGIEVEVLRYPQAEAMLMSFSGSFSLRAYLFDLG